MAMYKKHFFFQWKTQKYGVHLYYREYNQKEKTYTGYILINSNVFVAIIQQCKSG